MQDKFKLFGPAQREKCSTWNVSGGWGWVI